jgi:hypothetical protein
MKKQCGNCEYFRVEYTGERTGFDCEVCGNINSAYYAMYKGSNDTCEDWEGEEA